MIVLEDELNRGKGKSKSLLDEIKNLEEIAEGGFGIVYKATLDYRTVAVKRFLKSQNINKYFLNEVI